MRIRTVVPFLAGALLLSACSDGADAQTDADLHELDVVVANPSAVAYYPIYVADAEGFFADEGLEVNVEALDGSSAGLQALSSGQADISSPAPGPLLTARTRDQDAVLFYNLTPRNIFSLVVPDDSTVQGPEGLEGATIGVGTADGAERMLVAGIMSDAGLVEGKDYEFLTVGDGGLATAGFERGDIDAYAAATPDVAIINARGITTRNITPDEYQALFGNGLAAMAPFIEENPEVIEGFGRAVARATRWGMENPEEALEIAAEVSPEEGSDPELAAALLEVVFGTSEPMDSDELGYSPPEAWQLWHDDLLESGELDTAVDDLDSAYTNDFVDAYNDWED